MSQESCSTLELQNEIDDCLSSSSKLLEYSRNAETLILPSNQCIPGMWSTEQSVIITEHSNYYEQMTLVIKQIKESGPDAPKPSLPKRPKSKLDSLFTQAKKRKTFNPQELHDYLRSKCVDHCGIDKQFLVEDVWNIQGILSTEQLLNILRRAARQVKRCEAQMLLLYIKFGAFLVRVKAWHEDKYDKNEIKESWRDWLKTNIDYSDRHARRLRNLSRVLEGYPRFGLVGLPVSYFTAGKLKDITEMLSNPEYAEYWRQPLPATTNETPQSQ
ncbi:unnamed protein product [Mytilus coruscus]|uniref:Uncharacterized protein n=1 Tax=Mytilus coruscus TaxID=42192 RepID=A0A6J8AGU4_MYTCO|nr:unnamed protein product [Mytilus coruscus]